LLNLVVPADPTGGVLQMTNSIANWITVHPVTIGYAVLGFVLGAAAHTITDSIVSAVKRKL
jgi:hypothetical protein